MAALKLRRRHRLRRKEIAQLSDELYDIMGCHTFSENDNVEKAEAGNRNFILLDSQVVGIYIDERPFLTIRGILRFSPTKAWVTVDMGAVKFLANGADVMAPGIIDAYQDISEGDGVWIRDERNEKPLAVGVAMLAGGEMVTYDKGRAIRTIHYIGDKIWDLDED